MTVRFLPHTADIRVALDAPDLPALYQDGVDAVRRLLVGDSRVDPVATVMIAAEGEDDAECFFRFLRELLFVNDVQGFLPARLESTAPPTVAGETFDPARHVIEHGVKAVTRHQYTFDSDREGFHAMVVFDL